MPKLSKKQTTMNELCNDFMDYCKLKGLSIKTMDSYEKTIKLFSKFLEEDYQIIYANDVEEKHIKNYIDFTATRGKYSYVSDAKTIDINSPQNRKDFGKKVSPITINNYIRNLKVFFTYLVDNKILKVSPMAKIEFLKAKRKAKDDITNEDFNNIIKAIDITQFSGYRDYVIINLIFDTGMRLGETLALKYDDVDLDRKIILIPAEINKGKKDRYVFFSNTMASILRKWFQYKDRYVDTDIENIFTSKHGTVVTVSQFERNFRVYRDRAGVKKDIAPHGLRNNFAKRCLMSGMDIYTLSRILGHSSVTVTEKAYLDLTIGDIKKNYQRFSPLENMKNNRR